MPFRMLTGTVWAVAFLLTFLTLAQPVTRRTIRRSLPEAARTAKAVGKMPSSDRLTLSIGLPLRNQSELQTLLSQLYDPASTNYHKFLTPAEFTRRFGPTEHDYRAVKAFATANGLRVPRDNSNRMLVELNGSVAQIERAFHTTLRTYQHPTEARTFYAPDADPSMEVAAPILSIDGLNNYALPHPHVHPEPLYGRNGAQPNNGSGPSGGYAGNDFRTAYVPGTSLTGSGQKVGMLQFDGYSTNDINYYESLLGIPSITLSNVLINGASGNPSGNGGEIEVTLDIEMAISMAPGLNEIVLYEAPPGTPFETILNQMANDNSASQLSCSWFLPGASSNALADQIFAQMDAQGQSFFNASGDADAYTGLISFPCDNPNITQVGGTSLQTLGPGAARFSESAWNRGNGMGTGGGISTQYSIPAWQTNINMTAAQGSTTMRNVPDVAMVSEIVYERVNNADILVGGTSAAAPLWAGFTALVNQQASSVSQPRVGFLNPLLSQLAAGPFYSSVLNDITTGSNTNNASPTNFFAVAGYDLCTGWGTPAGSLLIDALAPLVTVTLPASATEGNGVLTNAGEVRIPSATSTNITVTLSSSNTNKATVPATVTLLAGTNKVRFNIAIVDNALLDGTQNAAITAVVPGYGFGASAMAVFDNETATLQVSLPSTATEGQGMASGTVTCSAAPDANVAISLSSTDTNKIQVPASVVLPAGQTSVPFMATVVDNGQLNDPESVTVTAHVQNWSDGSAAITVSDGRSRNLVLTLPASAEENAGVIPGGGNVSIAGILSTNLPVMLISSNTSKLVVPSVVTIPAGQTSTNFDLTLINNMIADGNMIVAVSASAPSFTNGTTSMLVIDDETPDVPSDPRPANMATNVPANTNLSWSSGPGGEFIQNGDFETGTLTNWSKENTGNGDFVINDGTFAPPGPDGTTPPYAGDYSAVSEQSGGGMHVIYQDITLPPAVRSAVLSWEDRIRNYASQFSSSQYFDVEIRTTNDSLQQVVFKTQPGDPLVNDWTNRSFDLSSYAGQTIRIAFVEADSLFYFNVHLDNVSLQVSSVEAGVSNDVYFGTNPSPGPVEFQGTTTNTSWPLPLLSPETTYYWQIVAHKTGTNVGPVWQFTTAGVDHFDWAPIGSLQFTDAPISVTITALDVFNSVVSNFTGSVMLSSLPANTVTPAMSDNFSNGIWSGTVALTDRATNVALIADDGNGHTGTSNPFNLAPANMGAIVLTGPSAQTVEAGGTVTFCVQVDGTPNIGFQWNFNDTNKISDGTNAMLTLTNVQVTNAGNYSVTVSNVFGSTTSTDAMLTVIPLDHFGWSQIPSPRFVGIPFMVSIMAQDAGNNTFTNFNGIVSLSCTNGVPIHPTASGNFTQGTWTGFVAISQVASNLVIKATDVAGDTGFSYPIDVINPPRLRGSNAAGSLSISWPSSPSGFFLETSSNLSNPTWVPAGGSPILTNNQFIQTMPFGGTNQFFRLHFSGP